MWLPDSRRIKSVRSGENGAYTIAGLPPGEYYLCALTELDTGLQYEGEYLQQFIPSAVKISIGEGEKKTPFALLSRGVCGVCGTSLVLNLPGSPTGAVESLQTVVDVLPQLFTRGASKRNEKSRRVHSKLPTLMVQQCRSGRNGPWR
jgi:hypothetical protein